LVKECPEKDDGTEEQENGQQTFHAGHQMLVILGHSVVEPMGGLTLGWAPFLAGNRKGRNFCVSHKREYASNY
jgi:hypothetical protein